MSTEGFSSRVREQWQNPRDILSVLLITGPEVVNVALAQFYASLFKPVPFSFGWVAYAFMFLLKTAGRLKLRPETDFPHFLVRCGTEPRTFENASWLLGRILKDYESWMPGRVAEKIESLLEAKWRLDQDRMGQSVSWESRPLRAGIVVTVFKQKRISPTRDKVFWSGVIVAVVQAGIAAVPCGLYGQWEILLITVCGTCFAWVMGALLERSLLTRTDEGKMFALTQGRGYQHAIVIVGNGDGYDLEQLANDGLSNVISDSLHYLMTLFASIMVVLWTALLITTSGIESSTWYLMAVGALGMLQNIYAAGAARRPDAYGIHLDLVTVIGEVKTMSALLALEASFRTAGSSLLPIIFPGTLRANEVQQWDDLQKRGTEASGAS